MQAWLKRGFSAGVRTFSGGRFRFARACGRLARFYSVMEMPCDAADGAQRVGIFRLRMASTAWASCFAQDDRT
jgi:hypothetical protein